MSGSVDAVLAAARARLGPRPAPAELAALIAGGALVVDIRPAADRSTHGSLPGALVVERNVLEWRFDPGGEDRAAELTGPDQVVVLVCNEGYASSLAAAALRDVGLHHATDLDGGYQAWRQAGSAATSDPGPEG